MAAECGVLGNAHLPYQRLLLCLRSAHGCTARSPERCLGAAGELSRPLISSSVFEHQRFAGRLAHETSEMVVTRAKHHSPDFHTMPIPEPFASCTRRESLLRSVRASPTWAPRSHAAVFSVRRVISRASARPCLQQLLRESEQFSTRVLEIVIVSRGVGRHAERARLTRDRSVGVHEASRFTDAARLRRLEWRRVVRVCSPCRSRRVRSHYRRVNTPEHHDTQRGLDTLG
jgi:hypothetical protein